MSLKKILHLILVASLILVHFAFSTRSVEADEGDLIEVVFPMAIPRESDGDIQLEAWKLPDNQGESGNLIADSLFSKSRDEIGKLYGDPISSEPLDSLNTFRFLGLSKGWYYVRQAPSDATVVVVPFVLKVDGKKKVINAKTYEPSEEKGKRKFIKVSTSTAPLKGAIFAVLKEESGQLVSVEIDGTPYTVVSDEYGLFQVGPLPYGKYYLKEIEAPEGYLLSQETVAFEISRTSELDEQLAIKNKPITPPGIEIPYTGNAVLVSVISLGILLFLLGYRLVTYNRGHKR